MSKKHLDIQAAAKRMHTHTVTFADGSDSEAIASLVLLGRSNSYIRRKLRVGNGAIQYAIAKAKLQGMRSRFKNGETELSELVAAKFLPNASFIVRSTIAPLWKPYAAR